MRVYGYLRVIHTNVQSLKEKNMVKVLFISLTLLAIPVHAEEECKHSLASTCLGLADKTQQAAIGALVAVAETIPMVHVADKVDEATKETQSYTNGTYLGKALTFLPIVQEGRTLMFEAYTANKARQAEKLAAEAKVIAEANAKKLAEKESRNLAKMRLEAERQAVKDKMKAEGLTQGDHIEDSKLTIED